MAYVSGGGGGGLPPQTPQSQSSLGGLAGGNQQQQQQLLEALLLQQQAAAASQANPLSLLTSVLLQGQLGAGGAGAAAMSQQQQQSQQSLSQLQQLQNQLALQQLMNQNGGQLNALANPSLGLYYQLLQQQQQQQQQTLLQQLQAQQQQQAQQQAQQHQQHQQHQQQQHVQPQASVQQPLQISSQSHSAFQPPQQGSSSGSVESQMNAQERLLALLNEQQGHSGAMGLSAKQELEQRMMMQNNPAAVDRAVPRNSKEVHDRINKLISDNEAIIQPQEPLLKRRPYHRQVGQQSSMDDSNSSSTRTSPGIRDVRMLQASSRTQSLYEPLNGARAFGGSLTSGQPVIRQQQIAPTCPYCLVPFPNEAGLQCHQQRCSKRIEVEKANETALAAAAAAALAPIAEEPSSSRHPLKRRLLAAVAAEQETATSPSVSKLARKDSGDCIVVGETRAPERKESMGFEAYIHPGLPRRATIAAIPTQREPVHLPQPQPVAPVAPVAQQPQAALISPQAQQHLHQQAAQTAQSSSFAQMLQRCGYQAPQTQAYPIPPQANQAQAASTSAAPAPIPAPLQMQNGQAAAVTPTSIETQVQQQMRRIEVDQQSLSKCDGSVSKPYTLMLSEPVKTNPERNVRNRGRNITSEAFVCLTRPQPMFVEQKGNLSMYSNWHQVQVNEADAKLNLQFMGMCSPKPRTGVHSFWRYTVANRDMVQYKVTHSSFWDISRKLKQRQEEEAAREQQEEPAAIKIEDVDLAIVKEEPCSSYALRDEIKQENGIEAMVKEEEDEDFEMKPERSPKPLKKPEPLMGGHRTDEVYVYVRGRGRGRYVCDRCGIRCKKPSMLKKHIKSHTDVRPYKCKKCNFSFKTKGNLTKHLGSKTHRRRLMQGDLDESDSEDRLEIATPDEDRDAVAEVPDRLDDDDLSDEEDNIAPLPADMMEIPFRRFGQEQILFERTAHTPPSRWVMCGETTADDWPEVTRERDCSSAPPVAIAGPNFPDKKIISPVAAPMAIQFTQPEPSPAAGFSQTNGIGSGHARFNGAAALQNNMVYSFLPKEEGLKCDQCDKTFRKQAELTYHQMTHNVEKQQLNSKNRMFQCPECRHLTRTKASLAKHMETTHGSHMDESAMASIDPSASTQSVLGGGTTQVVNNPRSFMCNDCNIGFRKHGILAKHLRSKTHVTKLETLKRLPEDSLSLIQSRDNGACLNEVDTTDCEKARASLTAIVEAIREENKRATAPAAAVPPAAAQPSAAPAALPHPVPQPSSSLECREQLTSSPMPAVPVANNRTVTEIPSNGVIHMPRASYSETSTPFRSRCGSAASINTETPRKRSDSIISKLDPNHLQAMKLVSANVWVPPRPVIDQAQISRPDSATITRPVEIMAAEPMETTRSSCSSPVMRILAANGHRSPPLPTTTKCTVCHTIFDTPVDLQVHLYTDHISVKDGTFFKCPKKFCDKVYPNKDCLRTHVMAHYRSEINDLREDESLSSHASLVARGALLDDLEQRSTPMTDGSDSSCHSPVVLDVPRSLPSVESRPEELRLPCNFCDRIFSDAMSLQQHWFQDHTNRGHVCQLCDAGFTTQEALQHHVASHNQQSTNGVR